MKKFAMMAAVALLAAGCGSKSPSSPSSTAPPNSVTFTAALNPANEVPPVTNADASASGTGTFKMDLTRDSSGTITAATATFTFSVTGFPAGTNIILGHIHSGGPGVTGGAVVNTGLTAANPIVLPNGSVTNQTISGVNVTPVTLAQQIIDNPNGFYYNLHTLNNPGGAIRAQLVKQ